MQLTTQHRVPDHATKVCDRLTALVRKHAQRLLDDEYWNDYHIDALQDHTGKAYTYVRDDEDYDPFPDDDVLEYMYGRFKRCVYYRVTHVLQTHSDAYVAFRFITNTDSVTPGKLDDEDWDAIRHRLFDEDSEYVPWGVLRQVADQFDRYYDRHGRWPTQYTDLMDCPQPNGTVSYAPDHRNEIHNIEDTADGDLKLTLTAPKSLAPDDLDTYHDWPDTEVCLSTYERFNAMRDAGDGLGSPTLHEPDDGDADGYVLDIPIDIPTIDIPVETNRVLAVDLGVKKQATATVIEPAPDDCTHPDCDYDETADTDDESHLHQLTPPQFTDHPDKAKLFRLKAEIDALNDRLAALRRHGKDHTERFAQLLGEYRSIRETERELREQIQHDVANQLVWLAVRYGCETIVFESLGGLEDGTMESSGVTAWSISSWARGKLLDDAEYKAELFGLEVETVNPWGTSRYCPRCGDRGKTVRAPDDREELDHGGHFVCDDPECFEGDRDYVGALNVARKYLSGCRMEEANPAAYTAAGNHADFPSRTCSIRDDSRGRCEVGGVRDRSVGPCTSVGSPSRDTESGDGGVRSAADGRDPAEVMQTRLQDWASGRQTRRFQQRAAPRGQEGGGIDVGGLQTSHGGKTGWRCPRWTTQSVTGYVLARARNGRMVPNPTEQ